MHAFVQVVVAAVVGGVCGYAFRGKINKGIKAAGAEAGKAVASAGSAAASEVKKL